MSVGSSIVGSGTVSTRTSRLPCQATAFIGSPRRSRARGSPTPGPVGETRATATLATMYARQGIVAALVAAFALALGAGTASAGKWHYVSRPFAQFHEADYVTTPPTGRGRLFVVIRTGLVLIIDHGKVLRTPFLDQRALTRTNYQQGLLSITFAPDYAKSGRLYVHYVRKDDTVQLDEIRRSATDPNRVDESTRRHLINVGRAGAFHHGGQLAFGPDGMLYMSTGVHDDPHSAQRLGDLHGKILRIDPRPSGANPYTVPPDNPYAFTAGARPEIWALGFRNLWRFSFDPVTGDMVLGDVGENTYEEVDYIPHGSAAGANFGFDFFEGNHRLRAGPVPEHYVPPVIEHKHNPYCAVMSGYVVRDRNLHGLYGKYLYGDLCRGNPRVATLRPGKAIGDRAVKQMFVAGPVSFGEDNQRRLYAVDVDGRIYRLRAFPAKKSYAPTRARRISGPSARTSGRRRRPPSRPAGAGRSPPAPTSGAGSARCPRSAPRTRAARPCRR